MATTIKQGIASKYPNSNKYLLYAINVLKLQGYTLDASGVYFLRELIRRTEINIRISNIGKTIHEQIQDVNSPKSSQGKKSNYSRLIQNQILYGLHTLMMSAAYSKTMKPDIDPIVTGLHLQDALKDICPIWPIC